MDDNVLIVDDNRSPGLGVDKGKPDKTRIIDGRDLALDDWLTVVGDPPDNAVVPAYQFPTDKHRDDFIATVGARLDAQIRELLLRFLIPTCSLGSDESLLAYLRTKDLTWRTEFERRLVLHGIGAKDVFPWEGVTWVLDLLPDHPREALEGLNAFVHAHIQYLPDGRLVGLGDARAIIRAKYLGTPETNTERIKFLLEITPRQFEQVVERTYAAMGYKTELTPPQQDGGRDVVASNLTPGRREVLQIECKRYSGRVGVALARSLLGVVTGERSNRGVLICPRGFTRGAIKFARENPRLELVDGVTLVGMMNEHLGSNWPARIDSIALESEHGRIKNARVRAVSDIED